MSKHCTMNDMKCFLLFAFVVCCIDFAASAGKLDINIEKVEVVEQNAEFTKVSANVVPVGNHNGLNVNFTCLKDMPPLTLLVNVYAFYAMSYHAVPIKIKRLLCDVFQNEFKMVESEITKFAVIPTSCPITKGEYYIKEFVPNAEKFSSFGPVPWEKVKLEIKFATEADDTTISILDVYVKINSPKGGKKFG